MVSDDFKGMGSSIPNPRRRDRKSRFAQSTFVLPRDV